MYDLVDFILSQSEWLSSRYKSFNPSKFVFVTNGLKDKPNFNELLAIIRLYMRVTMKEDYIIFLNFGRKLIDYIQTTPYIYAMAGRFLIRNI